VPYWTEEVESSLRCMCATLGGAARCGTWIGSDREEETLVRLCRPRLSKHFRCAIYKGMCYLLMAPEKRLLAWSSKSLCVVNDQPVGNPKRKV
jgi:hypothetical protein